MSSSGWDRARVAQSAISRTSSPGYWARFLTETASACSSQQRPFAATHDRFDGAAGQHSIHGEIGGTYHEVNVHRASVPAGALEPGIIQRVAAVQRELVGRAERHMAGRILVEQRVVE